MCEAKEVECLFMRDIQTNSARKRNKERYKEKDREIERVK